MSEKQSKEELKERIRRQSFSIKQSFRQADSLGLNVHNSYLKHIKDLTEQVKTLGILVNEIEGYTNLLEKYVFFDEQGEE